MTETLRERVIARLDGRADGPTLVVFGAVHGNETAGVDAIERVLGKLRDSKARLRGTVLGLVGNRRAMTKGRRFLGRDLNRAWTTHHLCVDTPEIPEDFEQQEILDALGPQLRNAHRPITFLDLHSTSGDGIPFALAGDVLRNRPLAFAIGVPVVLGLDEVVEGAMLGHFCDLGHVGVAIEGGRQGSDRTVDRLEAAIWVALVELGILEGRDAPDLARHRRYLETVAGDTPHLLEVAYRHVVTPEDRYEMKPGYRSFQPIAKGEVVGTDRHGSVRAPMTGLMLLPRYQSEGEDGFFIARTVSKTWLRASAWLRRLGLHRTLRVIPGVDPADDHDEGLVVRGRAATWLTPRVFHLFGYRRTRVTGDGRVVIRRRPDGVGLHPGRK